MVGPKANSGSGVDQTFFFEAWVKPSTSVLLFPRASKQSGMADYEVLVYTADVRGAGTDAKVSIKVREEASGDGPEGRRKE